MHYSVLFGANLMQKCGFQSIFCRHLQKLFPLHVCPSKLSFFFSNGSGSNGNGDWKGGKKKLKVRRHSTVLTTGPHGHPTARIKHLTFHILLSPALRSTPLCRVATYAVQTQEFLHLRRLGQVRLTPFLGAPILSTNPRSVFSFIFIFIFQEKERKKKQASPQPN